MIHFHKDIVLPLVVLPAAIALFGLVGCAVLVWGYPEHYFRWYPLIPVFFILLSFVTSLWLIRFGRRKPEKMSSAYLLLRGVKLMSAMAFLLLYYLLVYHDWKAMVLTTFLFYFLYLFTETGLFYLTEKKRRQKVMPNV